MDAYKSSSSRLIHKIPGHENLKIWQRSFYDHILHNERDWQALHEYILANLQNWPDDPNFGR